MGTTYIPKFTDIIKGLATLIPVLIMSLFLAFLPAYENNVLLEVDPVTTESSAILLTYTNNTNRKIMFPANIESIEKKVGDSWFNVEFNWTSAEDIAIAVPPKDSYGMFVWITPQLSEGEYRITTSYPVSRGIFTKAATGYTSATFTVTESE